MSDVRRSLRFLLDDEDVELDRFPPGAMLLDFLRDRRGLTGTKEGCAEGDCGACTVLIGRLRAEKLIYESANACIRPLASLDARHVVTIERLARRGTLHPIQRAMVEEHGAQCGFCTPGIVMALHAHWLSGGACDDEAIDRALQGNLCRCTGYAPIVRAAKRARELGAPENDRLEVERARIAALLGALRDRAIVEIEDDRGKSIAPKTIDQLRRAVASNKEATLIAGATDVGLWITKALAELPCAIFLGDVEELAEIEENREKLSIGAGASWAEAEPHLVRHWPELAEYWSRIGGPQIRNAGTLGGNVANGSPIGDGPPVLIALGAELVLMGRTGKRRLKLEDFFLEYGKQDRKAGEFVRAIEIPLREKGQRLAAYKVSKRRDEDIAALAMAARLTIHDRRIREARIAFGGMAGTPERALAAEAALRDAPPNAESFERAGAALAEDFSPISDHRASAAYRAKVARNLLRRLGLELAGVPHARLGARDAA